MTGFKLRGRITDIEVIAIGRRIRVLRWLRWTVSGMSRFGIKSVTDGIELVLGPVADESGHYYRVQLRSPIVTGSLEVYDHSASDLAAFFGELSALWWRGWDGEKTYESLEGQLRLVATRDALGHVYFDVEVRDGMGGPDSGWGPDS